MRPRAVERRRSAATSRDWTVGRWSRAAASIAALALVAGLVGAEQGEEAPMRAFFEPLEVPLVNVEVYVADADGRPVSGLEASDFEVFEDGDPVAISHFYASPGVEAGGPAAEAEAKAAVPPAQRLYLAILVDDTNLAPSRRRAAFAHLHTLLGEEMPADLRVMVLTYDGDLHIRGAFAAVDAGLEALIDEVAGEASFSRRAEVGGLEREMRSTAAANAATEGGGGGAFSGNRFSDEDPEEYLRRVETYAKAARDRSQRSLGIVERFVRSLSGIDGRKAVLLVSDGLEARPGEYLFEVWESVFGRGGQAGRAFQAASRFDLGREIEGLAKFANAHRVSLFVLSTLAERQLGAVSAASRGPVSAGAGIAAMMREEQALTTLAAGTGGRVLVNSPALGDQLHEVAVELGSYYSLAYRPDHVGDGAYHRIKVKVAREGVEVRHREGYLDAGESDRMADRTLAAAVLGVTDNPLGVTLESREQEARDDGTFVVPILVKVPLAQLVLVPGEVQHKGQVSILLAVQDEEGRLSGLQRRVYPVEVPNEQVVAAAGQDAGFQVSIRLRAGSQRVAVGVRDEVARVEATATLEVEVGGTTR